jgi:hypothetical protein
MLQMIQMQPHFTWDLTQKTYYQEAICVVFYNGEKEQGFVQLLVELGVLSLGPIQELPCQIWSQINILLHRRELGINGTRFNDCLFH